MRKHSFSITLLILFFTYTCHAQNSSPNKLHLGKDIPIFTVSSGLIVASYFMKQNKPLLTIDEINKLDKNNIWRIDRSATKYWSPPSAVASDVFMFGSMATPALFTGDKTIRNDWVIVGVLYLQTLFVNAALTNFTKEFARRERPFVYNPDAPMERKQKRDATSSFFSGHTSFSAASTFFTAKVYSDYYPDSKFKPYAWGIAAVVPAVTGFLRYRAGKHFPTDIVMGYAIGAATGILIPVLHKK